MVMPLLEGGRRSETRRYDPSDGARGRSRLGLAKPLLLSRDASGNLFFKDHSVSRNSNSPVSGSISTMAGDWLLPIR